MGTIKICIVLVCFAFTGGSWNADSGVVGSHSSRDLSVLRDDAGEVRSKILKIARAEIGVREKTGNNDGERVEQYLTYVGFKKGNPYCAAWASWVFGKAGYKLPKTAWSPALFPTSRLVKSPKPADVFGIYFPSLKRIAHCGLIESFRGSWITSIEANTNIAGSRDGDGVWRRIRHQRIIHQYSNWIAR